MTEIALGFKYRFLLPLLARFPQKTAYRLVNFYARVMLEFHSEERTRIIAQLKTVFLEKNECELKEIADSYFLLVEREALDTWFFRTRKTPKQVEGFIKLINFHYLTETRKLKQRVIISSGHFGRFWMAGVGMQAHGVSVGTITRDGGETNEHSLPSAEYQYRLKKLAWLQQRFKGPFLVEGDLVRPIYRALDQYVMALFIDVPYPEDKNGCVYLPFLGKPTRFPLGPAKMAKNAKAAIIPFYVFESEKNLCAEFYPPINTEELSERDIMTQLVNLLEKQIYAFPEQWWLWQALPLMRQE